VSQTGPAPELRRQLLRLRLRLERREIPPELPFPRSGELAEIVRFVWHLVEAEPREVLGAVYLDLDGRPVGYTVPFRGSLVEVLVEGRHLFKIALDCNAQAMVLFHRHPAASPEPSVQDLEVTARLVQGAAVLGLTIRDHLIVTGEGRWCSLAASRRVPGLGGGRWAWLDLFENGRPEVDRRGLRRRAPVRFRDPETGETWAGRGTMATWIRRRLDEGRELKEFRVAGGELASAPSQGW
jgi:DNA repair protein RadC